VGGEKETKVGRGRQFIKMKIWKRKFWSRKPREEQKSTQEKEYSEKSPLETTSGKKLATAGTKNRRGAVVSFKGLLSWEE